MDIDVPPRGTKRTCQSCAVRFYDLGKTAPECPKCGAVFVPAERVHATRYVRKSRAPFVRRPAEPALAADADRPILDKSDDEPLDAETDEDNDDAESESEADKDEATA